MGIKFEFIKQYWVGAGETDCFGFCKTSSLLGFSQDAATEHAVVNGISRESLLESEGYIWMLVRQRLMLKRPIVYGENVVVTTWHRGFKGAVWYRDFELSAHDGIVGEIVTAWITADFKTKRIIRPNMVKNSDSFIHPTRNSGPELHKLEMPEGMPLSSKRMVSYSDLDINAHLNNVKAAEIVSDAAQLEKKEGFFVGLCQINYLEESLPGDILDVFEKDHEDTVYVCASAGGHRRFEAEISLRAV
jgi:acyl-ACP thioesterase